MTSRSTLLVLDDGELDDVVALLNGLRVEFAHLRGGAIPPQLGPPERVLITTPRRAMLAKDWPRSKPLRIAVVTEDSNTLRAMLRRVGFDLLLRRPVHPIALRLVLLRALYAGNEKRREERIACAHEVTFRSGFRRRRALLADVSLRGCRIFSELPLAAGARISLPLPKELSPTGLTLPCKVVRIGTERDAEGRLELGMLFENLSKDKHNQVRAVLKLLSDAAGMEETKVLGAKPRVAVAQPMAAPAAKPVAGASAAPAASNGAQAKPTAFADRPLEAPQPTAYAQPAAAAKAGASAAKPAQSSVPNGGTDVAPTATRAPEKRRGIVEVDRRPKAIQEVDRRQSPRAAFGREVARLDIEAESVLLGRDLSVGGMRVEYNPNLRIGDLLQLAIYASPREEPVVVKARVLRDAGDGLGLSFENVDAELAARLERIVARLPAIESLQAGESAGLGNVVSRVLSGFGKDEN